MIKKMVFQNEKLQPAVPTTKNVIFDLSGVLLLKKSVKDLVIDPYNQSSMVVVNFLETILLLKACRAAGHKLFVLSNLSIAEFERIQQEPEIASLFSFFDDIVISAMTPYEKPNHEIFTYFCQKYNLQPADCVFIDDKQNNLEGAQAASINKTILCSNFDLKHVRSQLVTFGILDHHETFELNVPTGQA